MSKVGDNLPFSLGSAYASGPGGALGDTPLGEGYYGGDPVAGQQAPPPPGIVAVTPVAAAYFAAAYFAAAYFGGLPIQGAPPPPPPPVIAAIINSVRERPPLRLSLNIATIDGRDNRWATDEPAPENVPAGLTFSSTMPGGYEQLSVNLARRPAIDYPDLNEFATLTVTGAGEQVAWQGRLETSPRTSGSQMTITPGAVGWQANLDDDKSAQEIFIDVDLTRWQTSSAGRRAHMVAYNADMEDAAGVVTDAVNGPMFQTQITGAWTTRGVICEALYDAGNIPIGRIACAWKALAPVTGTDPIWYWGVWLGSDDTTFPTSGDHTGNLVSVSGFAILPAVAGGTFAILQHTYNVIPGGTDGLRYPVGWTMLAVFGSHGLQVRGSWGRTPGGFGFYASDIVKYAVERWAPQLKTTDRAGASTITPSQFIIPQAVYRDPTTASAIIADVSRVEMNDWAVWDDRTFYWAPRNQLGRSWRTRIAASGLSEVGPQVDRIYNGVVVQFQDAGRVNVTVGPPGTRSNIIDATLHDSDITNPANKANLPRCYYLPNIGISSVARATAIGQAWLVQQRAQSNAGQARIVGFIEDERGVWWPAWAIRAGDNITFLDAHDPVPRRIVRATYDNDSKTCQIDLDSPPQGLQALLERYALSTESLGV